MCVCVYKGRCTRIECVCIYIFILTHTVAMYTSRARTVVNIAMRRRVPGRTGSGCSRGEWRRRNGNYVQRRVSGTRTFGRRSELPHVYIYLCARVCVSINISRGPPTHIHVPVVRRIIYGFRNPVRRPSRVL